MVVAGACARQTAVALEAEIREDRAAVERELRDAASHQSMRGDRNRARMLQMDEGDDSASPQGQSGKDGEEGSQGEGEDCSQEEGEAGSQDED